jgi:hypothetical protein
MSPVSNVLPIGSSTEVARKSISPSQPVQEFSQVLETANRNASRVSESAEITERQRVTVTTGPREAKVQTTGQGRNLVSPKPKAMEDTEAHLSLRHPETESGRQKLPESEESAGLPTTEPDQKFSDMNASNESMALDFSLSGMNGPGLCALDEMMISTPVVVCFSTDSSEGKQANNTVETAVPDILPLTTLSSSELPGKKPDEMDADSDIEEGLDSVPPALAPASVSAADPAVNNFGEGIVGSPKATVVAENAGGPTLPSATVLLVDNNSGMAPTNQSWTEGQPTAENVKTATSPITNAGLMTGTVIHFSNGSSSNSETAVFPSFEEDVEISLPKGNASSEPTTNQNLKDVEPGTIVLESNNDSKPSVEGKVIVAAEQMGLKIAPRSVGSLVAPIQSDRFVPLEPEVALLKQAAAEVSTATAKIAINPDTLQTSVMIEKESSADSKTKSSLEDNGKPLIGATKVAQAVVEKGTTESDYRTYMKAPKAAHSPQLEGRDRSDGRSASTLAVKTDSVITGSVTMESRLATEMGSAHISNQQTTSHSGLAGSMDQVDKAMVISQLIEKANWLSGKQGGELQISLKPEFLGRVNLQASMVDHALVATITVESSVVKTLLESQIGTLQQSLQDQGLPVSKIVVVQGNDMSFASFGSGQTHAEQHLPQSQPARMPFVPEFQPAEPEPGGTDNPPVFHQASIRSLNLIA